MDTMNSFFDLGGSFLDMFASPETTEEATEKTMAEGADSAEKAGNSPAKNGKKEKPAKAKGSVGDPIPGPVTIVGTGWRYTYGEDGKKYIPKDVMKAVFDAGFKEVVSSRIYADKGSNTIFVDAISQDATDDDTAVGADVTVILGQQAAHYTSADFNGLEPEEISLFDVAEKFTASHPEFAGCGLKFHAAAKIAVPVFSEKKALPDEGMARIYGEDGVIREVDCAADAALLKESYEGMEFYLSDAGVFFPTATMGKKRTGIYLSDKDFGLEGASSAKKVEEVFHLPFRLWLETFGCRKDMTAEDFGGKEKVTKDELLNWLKPHYRIFRSTSRKVDVIYDRAKAVVSVAVISGEKGALPAVEEETEVLCPHKAPILSFVPCRVENTLLGKFSGRLDRQGNVRDLHFKLGLPKIPFRLLDEVIQHFRKDLTNEAIAQIYWDVERREHYVRFPDASCSRVAVHYRFEHTSDILVATIHSHNTMSARFSAIDDADEQYTGLFGVIGRLHKDCIEVAFRAGMEGCFAPVLVSELFTNAEGGVA